MRPASQRSPPSGLGCSVRRHTHAGRSPPTHVVTCRPACLLTTANGWRAASINRSINQSTAACWVWAAAAARLPCVEEEALAERTGLPAAVRVQSAASALIPGTARTVVGYWMLNEWRPASQRGLSRASASVRAAAHCSVARPDLAQPGRSTHECKNKCKRGRWLAGSKLHIFCLENFHPSIRDFDNNIPTHVF